RRSSDVWRPPYAESPAQGPGRPGAPEKRGQAMHQQQGFRWINHLRTSRVGTGVLGVGMAAAFISGGLAVALLAGGHAANIPAQAAAPVAVAPVPAAVPVAAAPAGLHRELLVSDFAAPATTIAVPAGLHRELLVSDFAAPARFR